MARPRILDSKIMSKIAKKIGKNDPIAVNNIVSRKASRLGISAEADLIILAKEYGIGTSTYQRSLDNAKQAEVRDALPTIFASEIRTKKINIKKVGGKANSTMSKRILLKAAIDYLIQD